MKSKIVESLFPSYPFLFTTKMPLLIATMIFVTTLFSGSASARPSFDDTDPGNPTDRALECLMNTSVQSFTATPDIVDPFRSTTLSWDVDIPTGCQLGLSVAGKRVNASGSMSVTPIWEHVNYTLVGKILGGTSILASTPVDVDASGCNQTEVVELLLRDTLVEIIDEYDENEAAIDQIAEPEISIDANGLLIRMHVKASIATVKLDMRLKFMTRNGIIIPRFTLFRADASTLLPDDWVESKFYDKSEEILATFKDKINANETLKSLVDDERIFSIETIPDALRVTVCPVPVADTSPPVLVFGATESRQTPVSLMITKKPGGSSTETLDCNTGRYKEICSECGGNPLFSCCWDADCKVINKPPKKAGKPGRLNPVISIPPSTRPSLHPAQLQPFGIKENNINNN